MERFAGRVAMVTGASSGIGAAVAEALARAGMQVVGVARRLQPMQDVARKLNDEGAKGKLRPLQADFSSEEEILRVYRWIDDHLGGVSVVVNSAAAFDTTPVQDLKEGYIPKAIALNIGGVMSSCRSAVISMKMHNIKDGHIININSILGHSVPRVQGSSVAVYCGSKFAITAFCKALRSDLKQLEGFKIRVTNLSPGTVDTEMLTPEYRQSLENVPGGMLNTKEVSKAVLYAVSAPSEVEIVELSIQPTGELF